jgi:hypothetical protein
MIATELMEFVGKVFIGPVSLSTQVLSGMKFMGVKASLLSMAGAKIRKADFTAAAIRILVLVGADLGQGAFASTGMDRAKIERIIVTPEDLRKALSEGALTPEERAWLKEDLEKAAEVLEDHIEAYRSLLRVRTGQSLPDATLQRRHADILESIKVLASHS